ncbi:4a-hydroxytetrahydrobiopterin dehydratase [Gemmobacter denitrificans]|uniref:4a-hydroxytetrahydrobiopterin dehydratase n=1 Tax=Gemmobacter denitrificans TaxID=3123040 RepID=A0ABU8BUR2_9RHOB
MTEICEPCAGFGGAMTAEAAAARMGELHPDWRLDGAALTRRFGFRNFAKAMQMANLAGWLGEAQGHHPDLAFGWGWCTVTFTSHEAGGITANDFLCAKKLDAITGQIAA